MTIRLCLSHDELFERHVSPPGHPERPARLGAALSGFESGAARCEVQRLAPRDATPEELLAVHGEAYVAALDGIAGKTGYLDADTFHSERTLDAARRASGAALAIADALLDGRADHGFALMRPPGHHARPSQGMGFCLLNHVAVAARHATRRGAARVLVLDWDVHHGNGTEEIFESSPEVLYVSLHQSPQYPGTGAASDVGQGEGRGHTLNVPLSAGADDSVYACAFERLVLPVVERFAPDLTLVSAGYDAHRLDPLGGMQLGGRAYGWMTRRLLDTLRRPMGFLLEGGYDLEGLREGVQATVEALYEAPEPVDASRVGERHESEIARSIAAHRDHWKVLA